MIENFFLKFVLKNKVESTLPMKEIKIKMFEQAIHCLNKTFFLKFTGVHEALDNTGHMFFKEKTDWIFNTQNTTFNFVYGLWTKDLFLNFVFLDKLETTPVENQHLYCMPYWIPFKLTSTDKDFRQEIINIKFETTQRPILKEKNIKW